VVPEKDVATTGHSLGEITMSHGRLVSQVEVSAMASNERGHWAPLVGALWDAASKGSSNSVSTMDCRIQTYGTEVTTEGGHGRRPFGVVNRVVSQKDVAS
jgi:hypothetical protein